MTETASDGTSVRATWCLRTIVVGYLALAVVAGAPNSPLTVLLPTGVSSPGWAAGLARLTGVARVGRPWLIAVAWVVLGTVVGAFALVLRETWANRVRLSSVLAASGISLTIAVAAPLLLSRDVYTYAAYGRIQTLYRLNPYVVRLSSLPHDPFVAVASVQWLHTPSHYGPLFTLLSAAITRTWAASPGTTIVAFKVVSGVGVAAATGLVAMVAVRLRPDRASLAVALVGLNPVLVVHTVGGGHVDALIAATLGGAAAVAVSLPSATSVRALGVTLLLTAACLVKVVVAPALGLWVWWLARADQGHSRRTLAAHIAVAAAAVGAALSPYVAGWRTLAPVSSLGGVEAWASPSQLVGRSVRAIVGRLAGSSAGSGAASLVHLAFLVLFAWLFWRLARRSVAGGTSTLVDGWGTALLLLALSMPFLLPWYAAWFAPFLGLMADDVVRVAGVAVTVVLALTLIPADPFHGYSTPGVMNGVHYGAASALLVALVVVARRVLRPGPAALHRGAAPSVAFQEHDLGPTAVR